MDIFAGCGGLSEGFQQAGAAICRWAIEYEHPAAEAFKLNHTEAHVMCNNCNVILTAAMHKAGLQDICRASPEVCTQGCGRRFFAPVTCVRLGSADSSKCLCGSQ